jgi:phospholipid/cholesterol/gamma-HCH transport system permease protein
LRFHAAAAGAKQRFVRSYEVAVEPEGSALRMAIRGRVEIANAQEVLEEAIRHLEDGDRDVHLDLSGVEYFDSGGGAVLLGLRERVRHGRSDLTIVGSTPEIDGFLSLVDEDAVFGPSARQEAPREDLTRKLGGVTLAALAMGRTVVVFTGEMMLGLLDAARHPAKIRWRETWLYMQRTGVDGLPIVALISFLMGLITAFQAAVQLRQFGADIYIANLVGLSIVRELGPLMTAIIAAGRSGAAFAAEIGTMKVSEEIDALSTMGLDRTRFLVTPKVLALLVMLPLLTVCSDVVGLFGGLVVARVNLELPAQVYLRQLQWVLVPWDVISGLIKSVVFALLVAGVGCLWGFEARGGAESVGRITTAAIVAGIFMIIVADAVFTVVFYYW